MADFKGKDILNGAQFAVEELESIMSLAADFDERLSKGERLDQAKGQIMGCLFFEPSTRTRLSFETAMRRLSGEVVGFAAAGTTSAAKGESLADTIRTVDQYVDIIVMRHPQIGSAKVAAAVAQSPIINGGDGAGQHPTQALLDLYTIQSELGGLNGGTIVLCGDLKNGRTVHAGVELYKHFPFRLVFVAPDPLRMPVEITANLRDKGLEVIEETDLEKALSGADVLYMTRIGVWVDTEFGREHLRKAGAEVDDNTKVVRFPRSVAESSLMQCPRQFSLGARRPGWDLEMNAATIPLGGTEVCGHLGMLNGSMLQIPENLLVDHEICMQVYDYYQDFDFDEHDMALDVIKDLGPKSHLLRQKHTRVHLRDFRLSRVLRTKGPDGKTLPPEKAAFEEFKRLQANHQPEPLPDESIAELDRILATAEREAEKLEQ